MSNTSNHNTSNTAKKTYHSPTLTTFGNIAAVTAAKADGGNDGNGTKTF